METIDYQKQANDFAEKHGITLEILGRKYDFYFPDDVDRRHVFRCRLSRAGRQYTLEFGQSIAEGEKKPTMYDILSCLEKYDPGTFEDFCSEFGYDEDSRTAERTYIAVCKEWQAVERLFGDILEELQEIQ